MAKRKGPHDRTLTTLREVGLAYPGAHHKAPWPGHFDLAVNDKTFAYLSLPGEPLSIGVKLPRSNGLALALPFCVPTAYGLGKSGWVTAKVPADEDAPEGMFLEWLEESYRAQAPKKLVKELDARAGALTVAKRKPTARKRPAPKARSNGAAKKR
jgi:predicted DNA-binding protein (MmcQ/YjbR family)